MARAVVQAQEIIARKDEQIAVLAPRAEAWDELASADGDYEVGDAAKILARAGVETGRQRLFGQLAELGWIYRGAQGKWKARQSAVDSGWLAEKPQSHHHPRSGEVVLDPPQVRVTVRGIERLRVRLGRLELATL
ncbi:phage antirepressor KilAC domain-containing protein [Microbacterium oxydans]|nr:phage antirepressor KilAC domain-containing protein [Microbacterium oxydans]